MFEIKLYPNLDEIEDIWKCNLPSINLCFSSGVHLPILPPFVFLTEFSESSFLFLPLFSWVASSLDLESWMLRRWDGLNFDKPSFYFKFAKSLLVILLTRAKFVSFSPKAEASREGTWKRLVLAEQTLWSCLWPNEGVVPVNPARIDLWAAPFLIKLPKLLWGAWTLLYCLNKRLGAWFCCIWTMFCKSRLILSFIAAGLLLYEMGFCCIGVASVLTKF